MSMSRKQIGDYEAWTRFIAKATPDDKRNRYYDSFQKVLHAIKDKAMADIQFVRFILTEPAGFHAKAEGFLLAFSADVLALLSKSDLPEEVFDFMLQEYMAIYRTHETPLTLRELLVRTYGGVKHPDVIEEEGWVVTEEGVQGPSGIVFPGNTMLGEVESIEGVVVVEEDNSE
jgi:hypothetical protein